MLLICFGTRPEWIKIKPLLNVLDSSSYELLYTGQHTNLLEDVKFNHKLIISTQGNPSDRANSIISNCLGQWVSPLCDAESVLVQGDTASVLGCALSAFNYKQKVIHLEAGLRSYNLKHPFPEEGYRQMVSRIASINLTPTRQSAFNLLAEGIDPNSIHIVGNTVLDNIVHLKDKSHYGNTVLVTLHRNENHALMLEWFNAIELFASKHTDLQFIFPMHPSPLVQLHRSVLKHVNVVMPMSHEKLIETMLSCRFIITDSGGIQEEGSFLNKRVIVCREKTERQEGIESGHSYMCKSPILLNHICEEVYKDYAIDSICPYGDGKSAEKIKELI